MATTAKARPRHPRTFLEVMGSPGWLSYRLWVRGRIVANSQILRTRQQLQRTAALDAPGVPTFQREGGTWRRWP